MEVKSRNKWEQRIKRMDLCFLSKKLIRSRQRNTIGIGGRSINLFWPMGEKLIVLTGQLVPPYHPAFSDLTRNLKARLEWSTLGQFSDEWSHYQLPSGLISFNKLLDGSNLKTLCVCVCVCVCVNFWLDHWASALGSRNPTLGRWASWELS